MVITRARRRASPEKEKRMHLRLMQLRIQEDKISEAVLLYDEHVIPALKQVPQCLSACFLMNVQHPGECVSLTVWETKEGAEAYERGEVFRSLLERASAYFAPSSEWRIELTHDLQLDYHAVPEEPVVKSFTFANDGTPPHLGRPRLFHMRLLSMTVREGMREEFERIYEKEILPGVLAMPGCRQAFLVEGARNRNEMLSITVWDTPLAASHYEASGQFEELKKKASSTFSSLYQWKMKLERETGRAVATTDDLSVEGYRVVTGKAFE